jgi:hypothetical protein
VRQISAGLSHAQWRMLGPAEKIERLFDMSLDDLFDIQEHFGHPAPKAQIFPK